MHQRSCLEQATSHFGVSLCFLFLVLTRISCLPCASLLLVQQISLMEYCTSAEQRASPSFALLPWNYSPCPVVVMQGSASLQLGSFAFNSMAQSSDCSSTLLVFHSETYVWTFGDFCSKLATMLNLAQLVVPFLIEMLCSLSNLLSLASIDKSLLNNLHFPFTNAR